MSNRLRIIFILILIAFTAFLWWRRDSFQSLKSQQDKQDFAVKEIESISRIFMADKFGKIIDLKKLPDDSWILNDKFPAWQNRVQDLLAETIGRLKVRSTVPLAARDNVLARMSVNGVKVMIYTGDDANAHKVYYVGGTTPDLLGTYFLMEDAKDPLVLHVHGHNGYLDSRFTLDKDEWMSRTVFGSPMSDILEVGVEYPSDPNSSFTLYQRGQTLEVEMAKGLPGKLNQAALKSYLNLFEHLNFEGYDNSKSSGFLDSLRGTVPFAILHVTSKGRGEDELRFYTKPLGTRTATLIDKEGKALTHDVDRYYAIYNKLNRLLVVQDYTFGKVLVRYEDFLLRNQ